MQDLTPSLRAYQSPLALAGRTGVDLFRTAPFVSDLPANLPFDAQLGTNLGPRRCLRLGVLPWHRGSDGCLVLASTRPEEVDLSEMTRLLGPVRLARIDRNRLESTVAKHHGKALIQAAETSVPDVESCRNFGSLRGVWTLVILAGLVVLGFVLTVPPVWVLAMLTGLALVSMATAQMVKIAAMMMPRLAEPSPLPPPPDADLPRMTLLIPLFKERNIARVLLRRLQVLSYPRDRLEVLLILEDDDHQTRATINKTPLPDWMRVINVPVGTVRTKPRAMNYALNFATGDIIGIYDAEDAPAPDQLRRLAAAFHADPSVACLQGVLDYYNPRANWLSRCFTIEYAVWFRLMLPGLVRMGFVIPLGGTTVFVRRPVLESVHGWDAHNVTEDADLGVRLARHGHKTKVVNTVTCEEANNRTWPWVRQRSRWLKGYVITYLVNMRRPDALWRDLGPWRFLGIQLVMLTAILQFALAPLLWSFLVLPFGLPHPVSEVLTAAQMRAVFFGFLGAEAVTLVAGWVALGRSTHRGLAAWVPTMVAYFPLGTLAMYKALWEMIRRPFYWDKTMHGRSNPDQAQHPQQKITPAE